uniref:Nucleotide-diphospho-sugar transferase domain-containing protein n=1 Tax=viral metagenome TaxID=1070528 RepID=A0A6C0B830_9ZZZZ
MKIITAVVNNPGFIEIQHHTLKKYFKGDYEFIVFNDAKKFPDFSNFGNTEIKKQIEETCVKLNIQCINIPNESHKTNMCAATRCADSMNYMLRYQLQNPDKYLLLDSDIFLIDYFDIEKYSRYDCAVVLQSRNNGAINYFWNGIYYFDMTRMKNLHLLDWNCCPGCDVGGMMQKWLITQMANQPMPNTDKIRWTDKVFHTESIYFIKHLWSCSWNKNELPKNITNPRLIAYLENDIRNVDGKFFCEIYDDVFLHYRAGGNWMKQNPQMHNYLTNYLKQCLE